MLVATRLDGRLGNQLNHAVNLRRFEDRLRGKWAVITSDPHAPVVCLYVEDDTGALAPSHHQLAPRHKAPLLRLAVDGSTGDGRLVPASPVPPVWEAMSDRCQAVPSEHDTPTHQADLPVLLFIGKHDAMLLSSAAALCTRVPGGESCRRGQDAICSLLGRATRLVTCSLPNPGDRWT